MTTVWIALAAAALAAALVWRHWRRANHWAAELGHAGFAYAHVRVLPPEHDRQSFDVTLHDGARPHPIQRISVALDELADTGLETPDGFIRSEELEREIEDEAQRPRVWAPIAAEQLTPGRTRRFTLRFDPAATKSAVVSITLAVPITIGGGVMPVNLRVPLRDPRAIANWNERADLRLRARQLGVMANTLPGWADMRAREEALRAETGDAL